MVVYTVHVTCQDIDGGATEADGGASAPVGPSVATPLVTNPWKYCLTVYLKMADTYCRDDAVDR